MDWNAKWIWARAHSSTPNFYMYARKEFDAASVSNATVCVSCSTEYKLYVNGHYVGRGPSPCHPSFQYYDSYDIRGYIRPGGNVIGVLCYNYGVGTHSRPQAPGGLLAQMEITNGGGKTIIATDETWRVMPAPEWDHDSAQMFWTIGFQEIYDSRKKPVGWNVVGFDDSAWQEPEVIGEVGVEPWLEMVPRQIPALKEQERFPDRVIESGTFTPNDDPIIDIAARMYSEQTNPEKGPVIHQSNLLTRDNGVSEIAPTKNAYIVLDFGREVVGFPTICVTDGGRGIIDIGYSEALDDNGRVNPTRQDILQADRLILHGGRQDWETFGRRAFRYMQLSFRDLDRPVRLDCVSIKQVGYPVEQVSSFECSDDLLNRIWQTGVYTLGICMQDHYEDCPLREHGQYPGDVRVEALMNYYCFNDSKLVAKALWQYVQCQRENGLFNALWPSSTNHILPDYNLVWVLILHDYYLYTGDAELVNRLYENLRLLMENWLRTQESEHGLLTWEPNPDVPNHEWWLFIDHEPLDKHGEVAAYNAFYYQALRDASKLAAAVGRNDDSVLWHRRAEHVREKFNEHFWSDELGAYVDCNVNGVKSKTLSVQTNTLAVIFGLADNRKCKHIAKVLTQGEPVIQSSGPYFDFYVLLAMAKLGMASKALARIRLCWGGMLERGASTWWETFDPSWPTGKICPDSLCHAWSAAPTYFLPAEILGVRPSMPESDVVVIHPRVGDLQWAKGHIETAKGHVDVEWHSEPGHFQIDIDAPNGYIIALPIGGFDDPIIEELDLSPETPERRARKTYGWGNVIWRSGEEHDPYLDWLLTQEAEPPESYKRKERCSAVDDYVWVREGSYTHVRYEIREA
ncbi:glycoside hydrolase family 78 protein [bacterium]|nr:glycoside hydrolase family 78 protein [bacterium]